MTNQRLTPREHQIVSLVAEGYSDQTIAKLLEISPRTVRFHCDAARTRLQARNRAQLVYLTAFQLQVPLVIPTKGERKISSGEEIC